MNDIKISFDHMGYKSKPNDGDAKELATRIGGKSKLITQRHIRGYAECIGQNGHTVCPATFTNGRKKKKTLNRCNFLFLTLMEVLHYMM